MKIYKGGEEKEIHPVDFAGWEKEGWAKDPTTIYPEQPNSDTTPPALYNALPKETKAAMSALSGESGNQVESVDRLTQLQSMTWQELQKLAEDLKLEKPEGTPWKVFAEEIAKKEQEKQG